jgi:hypothetical protein
LIWLIAEDDRHLRWVSEGVATREFRRLDLPAVRISLGAHDLILAVVEDLASSDITPGLRVLRTRAPLTPLIVCTRFDRMSCRYLAHTGADRTLWLDDEPLELARAVTEVLYSPPRFALATSIAEAGKVQGLVLDALTRPLVQDRPPTTVKGLAKLVGSTTTALERLWHRAVQTPTGMTPHRFVQWCLVIHAHERRSSLPSWSRVAHTLGIDIKTLRSAATQSRAAPTLTALKQISDVDVCLRLAASLNALLPELASDAHIRR